MKAPRKREELQYSRALVALQNYVNQEALAILEPVLRLWEPAYVADAETYVTALNRAFDAINTKLKGPTMQRVVATIASDFVGGVTKANRQAFNELVGPVLGVDLAGVVQREGLALETVQGKSFSWNVSLITNMTDDHLKEIQSVVWSEVTQGSSAQSMIQQIGGIIQRNDQVVPVATKYKGRAKLIARDQTAKLNADLNQTRQEALGIEEYRWVTAKDDRVRPTHAANEGKIFRWDARPGQPGYPNATGHPGKDIQCRCIAQPIINL